MSEQTKREYIFCGLLLSLMMDVKFQNTILDYVGLKMLDARDPSNVIVERGRTYGVPLSGVPVLDPTSESPLFLVDPANDRAEPPSLVMVVDGVLRRP